MQRMLLLCWCHKGFTDHYVQGEKPLENSVVDFIDNGVGIEYTDPSGNNDGRSGCA